MFNKNKRQGTAKQQANRAQLRTALRLIACGYLVYIMVQLFKMTQEGDTSTSKTVAMIVSVAFMVLGAVIIIITIIGFFKSLKAGYFKESSYTDDIDDDEAEDDVNDDVDNAGSIDAIAEGSESEEGSTDSFSGDNESEDVSDNEDAEASEDSEAEDGDTASEDAGDESDSDADKF